MSDNRSTNSVPPTAVAELASIILNDQPLGVTLRRIAQVAVDHVDGADEASVTVVEHRKARSMAFTGDLAASLDERQYEDGFGPCIDAAASGDVISIKDTSREPVYTGFAKQAARAGVTHTLSVGLPNLLTGRTGGLNVYGRGPGFSKESRDLLTGLGNYIAVAVINAAVHSSTLLEVEQMRTAMASRATIEQAKGIIMAQRRCTAQEAFEVLRTTSSHANRKLRDLADEMVREITTDD